jgi:hypothetical protein
MSAGTIVAIVIVVIIVAAVIAAASLAARRRRLQRRFGPEYDRMAADGRLRAEAELSRRERRVRDLDIRPLDPSARASYQAQWTTIQQQFVDQPAEAVSGAQLLITAVLADRGYPTEDLDQVMADLSVDHAATLGHFRTAQDISGRVDGGTASTEDLRQAMIHYRLLFEDMLGETAGHDSTEPVPEVPASEIPQVPAEAEPETGYIEPVRAAGDEDFLDQRPAQPAAASRGESE